MRWRCHRPPARGVAVLVAGASLRDRVTCGTYRQGFECPHRRFAAGPDSKAYKLSKFAFGQFLDGKLADDRRIAAAQGAAGILHVLGDLALTRFEIGEAFTFTLLGHNHHPSNGLRSEEHTSELQSLMRISYAVFCLKKKKNN